MANRTTFQFFIEKKLSQEAIKKLLSDVFDTSHVDCLASNSGADIFYEHQYYEGSFNTSIVCYVISELAEKKEIDSDKGLGLLVAKVSDEHVLVSGEQIDPYTWLLIEGNKIYEASQIDSDEDTMLIEKILQVASFSS